MTEKQYPPVSSETLLRIKKGYPRVLKNFFGFLFVFLKIFFAYIEFIQNFLTFFLIDIRFNFPILRIRKPFRL